MGRRTPSESTFRRILQRVDADELDTAVSGWLARHAAATGLRGFHADRFRRHAADTAWSRPSAGPFGDRRAKAIGAPAGQLGVGRRHWLGLQPNRLRNHRVKLLWEENPSISATSVSGRLCP